jgi:gas vesicle protein GvpL/GvpF
MAARVRQGIVTVIYLYGVTHKVNKTVTKIAGIDGVSRVESLPVSGLTCWISRVSKAEYADNLQPNMENLDWLANASIQHQRVVSAIAEVADILPARFGTVFLNESSLAEHVTSQKQVLLADLKRIKNSDEWGIKVFRVPAKPELPSAPVRSGKDYLKAKASLLQRRPGKTSDSDIQRFAGALKRIAITTAEVGKVSGGQRGLQWQTSLLLKRGDRRKLEALLRKFSHEWANQRQIEATGPWPPYSFVSRQGLANTV